MFEIVDVAQDSVVFLVVETNWPGVIGPGDQAG